MCNHQIPHWADLPPDWSLGICTPCSAPQILSSQLCRSSGKKSRCQDDCWVTSELLLRPTLGPGKVSRGHSLRLVKQSSSSWREKLGSLLHCSPATDLVWEVGWSETHYLWGGGWTMAGDQRHCSLLLRGRRKKTRSNKNPISSNNFNAWKTTIYGVRLSDLKVNSRPQWSTSFNKAPLPKAFTTSANHTTSWGPRTQRQSP